MVRAKPGSQTIKLLLLTHLPPGLCSENDVGKGTLLGVYVFMDVCAGFGCVEGNPEGRPNGPAI